MKKFYFLLLIAILGLSKANAQIDPLLSPYYAAGPMTVVMDSIMSASPDLLIFRPSTSIGGPFPTLLFQPGANSSNPGPITKHSYDLYWQHLASYGFVVIIINNTAGGPNATLFTTVHDQIKTWVGQTSHWMHNYVDLTKFAVAGHSNGGMNATDIIINRPNEIQAIIYMASYPNPGVFGLGSQNVGSYNGKVMLMCGSEDNTSVPMAGTTNAVAETAHDSKFTAANCKSWVLINGMHHGGFGNYVNTAQPVGTIGREKATASVRHYIVSFLLSQFKGNSLAFASYSQTALHPNSTGEFTTTCVAITSIEESESVSDINVFPNPATDKLNVNFAVSENKNISLKVSDFQGKTIITSIENGSNGIFTKEINISTLPKGLYLIEVSDSKNKQIQKFIKL